MRFLLILVLNLVAFFANAQDVDYCSCLSKNSTPESFNDCIGSEGQRLLTEIRYGNYEEKSVQLSNQIIECENFYNLYHSMKTGDLRYRFQELFIDYINASDEQKKSDAKREPWLVHIFNGRINKALNDLNKITLGSAHYKRLMKLKLILYYLNGNIDAAILEIKKVYPPHDHPKLLFLNYLLRVKQTGDNEKIKDLKGILPGLKKFGDFSTERNPKEMLKLIKSAIKLDPQNSYFLLKQAELLSDLGYGNESFFALKRATNGSYAESWTFLDIGTRLYDKGYYREAIEAINKGLMIEQSRNGYWDRAYVKNLMSNYQGCIDDYELAIKIDGAHPMLHSNKADCHISAGDYAGAKESIFKSIKIDSMHWDAWHNYGYLEKELGDKDSAIYFLEKAIEIDSSQSLSYSVLGGLYLKMNAYKKAEYIFNKSPRDAFAYQNLGDVNHLLGGYDQAVLFYDSCLAFDVNDSWAMNKKAMSLYHKGLKEEAANVFTNAINLGNTDSLEQVIKLFPELESLRSQFKKIKITDMTYGVNEMNVYNSSTSKIFQNDLFEIQSGTDSVECRLGVQFGVQFVLKSEKEFPDLKYQAKWSYPKAIKIKDGVMERETVSTYECSLNENTYSWFGLETIEELQKGKWKCEISIGGVKMYSKDFYLY